MARTLRSKYLSLFIAVMESDPKHEFEIYYKSFGYIDSEWEWCAEKLERLKQLVDSDLTADFNKIAGVLIAYIRYRLKNPAPKYQYPIPEYKLSVNKPINNHNWIGYKLEELDVFLSYF